MRRFFHRRGRFFIIYHSRRRGIPTLLLGPGWLGNLLSLRNRMWFLLMLSCLICVSIVSVSRAKEMGRSLYTLTLCISIICIISCVLTGMVDPGIIWSDANESQNDHDEKPVYCAICDVYRPLHASHCLECNACYLEYVHCIRVTRRWDHHCALFGYVPLFPIPCSICIAKKNKWCFALFQVSAALLLLLFLQTGALRSLVCSSFL